jgi:hypothetical protein
MHNQNSTVNCTIFVYALTVCGWSTYDVDHNRVDQSLWFLS